MKPQNQPVGNEFSKGNFEFAFPYFAEDVQWNVVENKGCCGSFCSSLSPLNFITMKRLILSIVDGYLFIMHAME